MRSSIAPETGLLASQLGLPVLNGDVVLKQNSATPGFQTFSYASGTWSPGEPAFSLGEGFWIQNNSGATRN